MASASRRIRPLWRLRRTLNGPPVPPLQAHPGDPGRLISSEHLSSRRRPDDGHGSRSGQPFTTIGRAHDQESATQDGQLRHSGRVSRRRDLLLRRPRVETRRSGDGRRRVGRASQWTGSADPAPRSRCSSRSTLATRVRPWKTARWPGHGRTLRRRLSPPRRPPSSQGRRGGRCRRSGGDSGLPPRVRDRARHTPSRWP